MSTAICALCVASCSPPRSTCSYPVGPCPDGQACALVDAREARCVAFAELAKGLAPPIPIGHELWCSQGGRSPAGRTHSYAGDLFALDLASPSPGEVPIVSPVAGVAYVFDGCEERDPGPHATNVSRCGDGYGNNVRVWDGTNLYLFGHLARVRVDPGPVERGQVLGVMGCSGSAGHRHVHMTITRPEGLDLDTILDNAGWKGQTPVRFRLNARVAATGAALSEWSDVLPCADDRESALLLRR